MNEPVETYFYDVLNLCRQIEEETGDTIAEINKVEYLLNGMTPTLLEKLWPLVPEPINETKTLLAAATKFAQAKEMVGSLQSRTLSAITPGLVSREEFDAQASEFRQTINKLRRELEERRFHHKPNSQAKQSSNTAVYNGRSHQPNRLHPNRTTDGRPICHSCRKPGHIARFCKIYSNDRNPRPINALHTTGKTLVKAHVLANGIEAVALIDTGAALTAVSEHFANRVPKAKCKWTGPAIYLANGQAIEPTHGWNLHLKIKGKKAEGVAVVMPLPNTDILVGNDLLRQFRKIKIHYDKLDDNNDFNTTPTLRASVVLLQDIVIPAKSIVPVPTELTPHIPFITPTAWIVEPSTELFFNKGSKPRTLHNNILGPNGPDQPHQPTTGCNCGDKTGANRRIRRQTDKCTNVYWGCDTTRSRDKTKDKIYHQSRPFSKTEGDPSRSADKTFGMFCRRLKGLG